MKVLFSVQGKRFSIINREPLIIKVDDNAFYDITGRIVPAKEAETLQSVDRVNEKEDIWDRDWIQNEGIEEKLIAESTKEIVYEIDDMFGLFGFKNRAGEFVIEPQYAFAVLVNNYNCSRKELKNLIDRLLINIFGSKK